MGLTAFRRAYFASDATHAETFGSVEARAMRYALYWAMYEQTSYDTVHSWATALKHQYGVYKHARNLYNPSYRLGNFYAAHLWGGTLDTAAGAEGAIPIETEHEELRSAIATFWKASNLSALKDVLTLRGSVEGDLILRVHDAVEKGRVYLERLDPGTVTALILDVLGNVKGYTVEEKRRHPESPMREVTYRLVVSRDGLNVVYKTFLNNAAYGWNGQPATWEEGYTFVPLVLIKHVDVGLDWGWSELHPLRSKVREVDDLASMISDQIRKTIEPVWLMKGMGRKTITITGAQANETGATGTRPMPSREELKTIWDVPLNSKAEPMIAPLNLGDALLHVNGLLKELERDYPELQQDIWATGSTSGRALRVARQRVEAKVLQRRANYDAGLVKIQMMALSIGGMRGYKGYEGLGLESYAAGELEHQIAARPVFVPDPMDAVEISQALWTAAEVAVRAGADLGGFLKGAGWSDERIAEAIPIVQPEPEEEEEEGEENADSTD